MGTPYAPLPPPTPPPLFDASSHDSTLPIPLTSLDEPRPHRPRFSSAASDGSEEDDFRELDELTRRDSRPGRVGRSGSLSTAFEFTPIPLSLSAEGAAHPLQDRGELKTIGVVGGISLVVGLQIGSGIFSSPGQVVSLTGSVGAALATWFVSGVLAWTGASSFAELGSAIPLSGGAQAYLSYAYGPLTSFEFTWTAIIALKPGGAAIIALIFGEYVCRLIYHHTTSEVAGDLPAGVDAIPDWSIKLAACAAVVLVSAVNAWSTRAGTGTQVVFTVVKLAALITVGVLGLLTLIRGDASPALRADHLFAGSETSPGNYALALYSGLWAFDGWDQVNYVAGEMTNVVRDLPRVIHISLPTVILAFLMANLSYFVVLNKEAVAHSNTVAIDFGTRVLGPAGGVLFTLMVAFSCFGALNGSTFTTSRLIATAAHEHFLPARLGALHGRTRTPVNAIALQAVGTALFVVFGGGFRRLVNFYSVANWFFYLLTVLAVVVLRVKEPDLERPYKTWITTPLIFSAVALFLLCMPIFAAPLEALAAFGFIAAGVPVYFAFARRRSDLTGRVPSVVDHIPSWIRSRISLPSWMSFGRAREGYAGLPTEADGGGGGGRRRGRGGEEVVEMVQARR